jgi:hypothetical protein
LEEGWLESEEMSLSVLHMKNQSTLLIYDVPISLFMPCRRPRPPTIFLPMIGMKMCTRL